MGTMPTIWIVASASVLINLPFGFWRAGTERFTVPWFVAVHAPVPVVVGVRIILGLRWQPAILPVLIGASFTGQFLGGSLRNWWKERL